MPIFQDHATALASTTSITALITAALMFGAVACADENQPADPTPASSGTTPTKGTATSTPTVSPSLATASASEQSPAPLEQPKQPSVPVKPEEMKTNTEEGAIAFANYFLEVYEYSIANGDTRLFKSFSAADCTFCQSFIQNIDRATAEGLLTDHYELHITRPVEFVEKEGNVWGLSFGIEDEGYSLFDSQRNIRKSYFPQNLEAGLVATWTSAGWVANEFDQGLE